MTPESERREGMSDVSFRLGRIESRLSRIEGGLVLAAFLVGAVLVPFVIVVFERFPR